MTHSHEIAAHEAPLGPSGAVREKDCSFQEAPHSPVERNKQQITGAFTQRHDLIRVGHGGGNWKRQMSLCWLC